MTTTMDPVRRRLLVTPAAMVLAGSCPGRGETAAVSNADTALLLVAAPRSAGSGLSYDDSANGPVVRIAKGAALAVTLHNRLVEPTGLQWHGLRAPNATDGDMPLVGQMVAPGETARMRFIPPDSGFTWFHPPAAPGLSDQTTRGLRGVLVVEEPAAPAVALDLVLTLGDDTDGAPTVNGTAAPLTETVPTGGRVRLRLLNASTTGSMTVAVEGARPRIVAIDGQPSDMFEPLHGAVPVGPGARVEMMVDAPATAAATLRLVRRGVRAGEGSVPADAALLQLTTAGAPREGSAPIVAVPRNPLLPTAIALERSVRADAVIEAVAAPGAGAARWRINGRAAFEPGPRPLVRVPRGGVVTFGFRNTSTVPVPLRVHGHVVRLLHARDDGWEPYWRDSVVVPPNGVTHVAFVADNPGRWLLESALFEQAAFGLRTWFEVA